MRKVNPEGGAVIRVAITPAETLARARDIGRRAGLRYVYSGNVPGSLPGFIISPRGPRMPGGIAPGGIAPGGIGPLGPMVGNDRETRRRDVLERAPGVAKEV